MHSQFHNEIELEMQVYWHYKFVWHFNRDISILLFFIEPPMQLQHAITTIHITNSSMTASILPFSHSFSNLDPYVRKSIDLASLYHYLIVYVYLFLSTESLEGILNIK